MIIIFFLGLIILASAGCISDVCNTTYLQLVCNIIGGVMMGGSTFFVFKEEARKKNELKLVVEKMSVKEEHENEIKVLNTIKSILQEYGESLEIIDDNQKKTIASVCDNSEVMDSIKAINEMLDNRFALLEKQVETQDKKNTEAITAEISNLYKCVEKISDIIPARAEIIKNTIETTETTLKDESNRLYKAVDALYVSYTEVIRQEENDFAKIIENINSVSEKLQIQVDKLEELKSNIIDTLNSIEHRIEDVNLLPSEINNSVESLIINLKETVENIQKNYKYLVEDIEDQEKSRTRKFNSIMNEISDSFEESNEGMAEEIKKLAEQYESFEKMISSIVKQMSHMAEEDIKVMKGFING